MITKIGGVWGKGIEVSILGAHTCLNCHRVAQAEGHTDCSCPNNHSSRCAPCACIRDYAGSHSMFVTDMDCGQAHTHPGVACIDLHDRTNGILEWIAPFPVE